MAVERRSHLAGDLPALQEIRAAAFAPVFAGLRAAPGERVAGVALDRFRAEGLRAAVVGVGGDAAHAPARRTCGRAGFPAAIASLHLYREL